MIFVNARFLTQNITGVQRFAVELLKALVAIRKDVVLLVPNVEELTDSSMLAIFNIKVVKGGGGHYWEQITLPRYLRSIHEPLLINLCNTGPVLYNNKISTIHDVTFLRYPESYSLKFRTIYRFLIPAIIKTSLKVLTVSDFSKSDLCNIYNLNMNDIDVLYNATSKNFKPSTHPNLGEPYALAVSSPNKHKNFSSMIQAFLASNVSLNLKIIGSLSNSFSYHKHLVAQDPRIEFLGRVSDAELIKLYQNADFFIFPSLYEGFGIPPLEAQACGCPVIASNAASLPEVLQQSAIYFDPLDINSIKGSIEQISRDETLRNQLIYKGHENLKRFSWAQSAIKLNAIIDSILV